MIIFKILSVKIGGNLFTLLLQKCIHNILDFASWRTKPKIFTLTQSMITLTLYRKSLLLLALGSSSQILVILESPGELVK